MLAGDLSCVDHTIRTAAIVAAGAVGSTEEGLTMMLSGAPAIGGTLTNLTRSHSGSQVDAMRTIVAILEGKGDARAFLVSLGSDFVRRMLVLTRAPFPDARLAGLHVVKAVTQHHWGRDLLLLEAGFLEYITDRRTEPDYAGKLAKMAVVEAMLMLPRPAALQDSDFVRLQTYRRDGPFYVGSELMVVVDMATQ